MRCKRAARCGGGCGLAPTWVRERPGCLPAICCRVLPGNELPGPKVSFPRLLTRQPRGTKEHRYFFSSLPDSSLEELIYSSVCSLKDIIYWLIVVITKC
ncbi:rCG34072 [Rattus norvegicus]|uniref:RCG34072 n=1 Tax=Rattus norvegicus TaxID=10116 RepID=A6HGZ5_RAT|nr:rCG34072 [Rattus norvegicus]